MPAQPLDLYRGSVQPEWIDYNGHMNLAYYILAFDHATDRVFERLGIGGDYVRTTRCSVFVAETHVLYERELKAGDKLRVTTQLIDADAKRLHLFHAMYHGTAGFRAATIEILALHVDLGGPRSIPFPPEPQRLIDALLEEHRALPRPPELGRTIGIRRR
jgi:acyl-CoA thioester hydrolase